jgi:hypothetical protein
MEPPYGSRWKKEAPYGHSKWIRLSVAIHGLRSQLRCLTFGQKKTAIAVLRVRERVV